MTSKTRSALTTEQTTNFADNTTGAITPAILRTTVQDMIDSMATQLDTSVFAGSAYSFTGSIAFTGSTFSFGGPVSFAGSTSGTTTIAATGTASGTQTLQAATDTFVYLATTDTLTNKTIGSALGFAGSTSGTMFVKATGAAGSGTLTLPVATDTLVGKTTTDIFTNKTINAGSASTNTIQISGVTLGFGQYPGTTTNDNATAGNIGEIISSTILVGSAVVLLTGSVHDITSIAVTAGDWDAYGNIAINPSSTLSSIVGWMSSTSATLPTAPNNGAEIDLNLTFASNATQIIPVGRARFSFSISSSIFLTISSTFGGSCTAYGFIAARRAR